MSVFYKCWSVVRDSWFAGSAPSLAENVTTRQPHVATLAWEVENSGVQQ
jgi:hypothetical protein